MSVSVVKHIAGQYFLGFIPNARQVQCLVDHIAIWCKGWTDNIGAWVLHANMHVSPHKQHSPGEMNSNSSKRWQRKQGLVVIYGGNH